MWMLGGPMKTGAVVLRTGFFRQPQEQSCLEFPNSGKGIIWPESNFFPMACHLQAFASKDHRLILG